MDEEEKEHIILGGRYRLLRLLHRRPRVNLYLAQRLPTTQPATTWEAGVSPMPPAAELVVVRELVLAGLPPALRGQIEHAAFDEFVAPGVLGSIRLPGAGDRVRVEGERHYLVLQLRGAGSEQHAEAISLAELLLTSRRWPAWLDGETVLNWSIQLCRIVARLHRLGLVLGDLNPATILVDRAGPAEWAPVLLASWPPAPQFWQKPALYSQVFPLAHSGADNAFTAPEMLSGEGDERADVYSLGALLYLLYTRYAPAAASLRQQVGDEGMTLIPPHLFNSRIPPTLEAAILRTLALNPADRYPSVFALIEALEAMQLDEPEIPTLVPCRVSRGRKVIEWVRKGVEEAFP